MNAYEVEEKTSKIAEVGCAVVAMLSILLTVAAACNWLSSL